LLGTEACINPLRGQNNVQGAAHMGCDPGVLTGAVGIEDRRGLFERAWSRPIPRGRGLNRLAMMDAAASVFEKDGTFLNAERRIQRIRKAVEPPQEVRADWQTICAMAERMGHGAQFRYSSVEDIWNEIRQVWPEAAGISYERLDDHGLQGPCQTEDDPGTAILHVGAVCTRQTGSAAAD
jgi:formate dehydrogenase major subunit